MDHMLGLDHGQDRRNIMTGDWIPNASPDCNVFRRKGQAKAQPKLRDPFYDKAGNHLGGPAGAFEIALDVVVGKRLGLGRVHAAQRRPAGLHRNA
jgi:hypothetical protein